MLHIYITRMNQMNTAKGTNEEKKPRGRPRINPIKDENEPKKPRGRQVGFKVAPKPKIELDAETLKQKKTEINTKTYQKRGKTIQAIKNIVIKNGLEPIDYKNMTDDELKQKYTELLNIYKGLQIQKQKEQLETKLKKLTEKIAPLIFV